ncbi:FAD-binding oxidoreductase [Caulobacter vibrioides]|uniref:NAD(P)/FAD-dependent oxidoreductase n=1 Tax=Caulobacter vibrioides TaxID=155892 RepID=UPI000BB4D300|nr:FAD-binding oxidoreductase [Caulobacter vibrioides]ATC26015.1 FAD-binding oxidoreductase [Caulobacter vibrioides]AZH14157.1 FAD-binding oxidoreductase [Caulobacter vibrioides]PLR16342.1 FAD-binding oxidoreductase [Caulobacter vibrioides]
MTAQTPHPYPSPYGRGNWYADTVTDVPASPPLDGDVAAEVCIVGAGFTGLGAALALGSRAVVLEAGRVGCAASGRNGGQVHTGQRRDQAWLEKTVGRDDALALWRLAEDARAHFKTLAQAIDCDWRPGMIHARHKPDGEAEDADYLALMAERYGYDQLELIGEEALADELGTGVYHGGLVDHGGGHVHPLKLAQGMAARAMASGAMIHEHTRAETWRREGGKIVIETATGRVTCDQLILSGDGLLNRMAGPAQARVMPINNFIAVTAPLGALADEIIRSNAAVSDSRFVVNYFRKTPDGRLLFGGGENYRPGFPHDIAGLVRKNLAKIYPRLADVEITHAWGGTLGITFSRMPFVGEVAQGVRVAAGYSGQGVMLAPYVGKLLAKAALGETGPVDLLSRLPTPPFPGGRLLRWPLTVAGLSWYALRDRL